jgi:class 3 adenylate cyclase
LGILQFPPFRAKGGDSHGEAKGGMRLLSYRQREKGPSLDAVLSLAGLLIFRASRNCLGEARHGCDFGFGSGIARGYATLGQIGFSERSGYTAIGTVCNFAARLCAEAKDGQILVSSLIAEAVEAVARIEDLGNLELKGRITEPG